MPHTLACSCGNIIKSTSSTHLHRGGGRGRGRGRGRREKVRMGKGSGGMVVKVDPKPSKGVISTILDVVEKAAVYLLHHQQPNAVEKNYYLSRNFAPAKEETPLSPDLPVKGFLPDCLNGEFAKVGPNPKFSPVAGYHWFDGDGMIHGLCIKDGKATYVSRYVQTSRLKQEEYFGGPKFAKLGDTIGFFGFFEALIQSLRTKLKVLDMSFGTGTGNTALIYHNGKVLALHEGDKPYVIKVLEDGDLQTLGVMDYDKRLNHAFSAHPKIDPVTDELFTFGYSMRPPYLTFRIITKDGAMLDPVPITIPEPVMMHDFAITENYAIFLDLNMVIRPKNMMEGKSMISFDDTRKARFGVLPRYAKDELQIMWFKLPSCFVFHIANAWEEDNEVVLVCCRIPNFDLHVLGEAMEETFENTTELYEMRFNMNSGLASQRQLSVPAVEFPRINERYIGRKQQYVYASIVDGTQLVGVAKFDLLAEPASGKKNLEVGGNIKGIFKLGPGRYGSEAIFVPRQQGDNCEEDDGYLIFFVYDENIGKSEVNVIDAKTMSSDPVAVVELPVRVPHGFHSLFVAEEQLKKQE